MEDLFSESDLDQNRLERERRVEMEQIDEKIKAEKMEKKTEEMPTYDKTLYVIDG